MPYFWLIFYFDLCFKLKNTHNRLWVSVVIFKLLFLDWQMSWIFVSLCKCSSQNSLFSLSCIIIARLALSLHASLCKHTCFSVWACPNIPKASTWSLVLFLFPIAFLHPAAFIATFIAREAHSLSYLWHPYYQVYLKFHCTIFQLKLLAVSWVCVCKIAFCLWSTF